MNGKKLFATLMIAIFLMIPTFAQEEVPEEVPEEAEPQVIPEGAKGEAIWNETITILPTGNQVVFRHVTKGDLLEGNFTASGGPLNFYVFLQDVFLNQVEYGPRRVDIPIYEANLKMQDNFSIAIPFDGLLVVIFENPTTQTTVNVTYHMNYIKNGAVYLREGRVWDEMVVLTPERNFAVIPIPNVMVGDRVIANIYSIDGSINVYLTLDTAVNRSNLPPYYREIYPYVSIANLDTRVNMKQIVFASGTLLLYIHNPAVNSNRTVVYHLQCIERGPIMRVILSGLEHGRLNIPPISLKIPSQMIGAVIQFTMTIYEISGDLFAKIVRIPLVGPIMERIWDVFYYILFLFYAL